MTQLISTYMDLFAAGLALLSAGLLHGTFRLQERDDVRHKDILFITSVTTFGLAKTMWVLFPLFAYTSPFHINAHGVMAIILGILHLSFNQKSTHSTRALYIFASIIPVFTILYENTLASSFAWIIIGGAWLISGRTNPHHDRNKKTLFLTAIGSALLILMGIETEMTYGEKAVPVIKWLIPSLELSIAAVGSGYIIKKLYSGSSQKEFHFFIGLMVLITITYFLFVNRMMTDFKKHHEKAMRNDLVLIKERLDEYQSRCLKELKLLSWHPMIREISSRNGNGWAELSILEMELGASMIFLLDERGNVVASSSDVIMGKNFISKTYFKQALQGHTNIYISRDRITNTVGAFFTRPLADQTGAIHHVLVMRMPLTDIIIPEGANAQNIMLINPDNKIIAGPANHVDKFLFDHPIQAGTGARKKFIMAAKERDKHVQFKRLSENLVKDKKGNTYLFISIPIKPMGFFLARTVPYELIFLKTGKFTATFSIILLAVLIIGLRWFHIREWANFLEQERARRKKAEGIEYLLTSIIEEGNEGVMITDQDGTIEYVNKAFSEITGYRRSEVIGKHPRILTQEHNQAQIFRDMRDQISRGHTWHGRMVNRRKNGDTYEADIVIFPLLDEEDNIKYICIQRDITDEVLLQKQLIQAQKMEAVGTLAGGVAHDFNNMLTGLQGYAEIGLMRLEEDHPLRYNLEQIMSICKKASGLIRQLLIFSSQESSEKIYLDLNQTIEDISKLLNRLIGENIEIVLELARDLPCIMADPVNMEQILVNLVVNARDAMERSGKIIIKTELAELTSTDAQRLQDVRPGKYVKLSVEDNGCGIPEDILPNIFDPFFTTKGVGKGTGLGLSVVYSIVKQHSGLIEVHSEPGRGTCFNIYLPVAARDQDATESKDQQGDQLVHGGGKTLLFIEDEEHVLDTGKQYLEQTGFRVLTATTLEEGKKIIETHGKTISLIISDIILPDGNGYYFLKAMKIQCPIIFTTGYMDQPNLKTDILKGGNYFLEKPYSKDELLRTIIDALEH